RRLEKILADQPKGSKGVEGRVRVLKTALDVAPRLGEEFGRRMLEQALPAYDALPEPKDMVALEQQAEFLARALFVAGHFGRMELMQPLVARFRRILQAEKGQQGLEFLEKVAAQCFRGLRKLGMRDEIDQILKQMADLVLGGQDVKGFDFKKYPNDQGPAGLRGLQPVASQWYFFRRDGQTWTVVTAAGAHVLVE